MKPSLNHLNLSSLNFKVLYRYFATYCHRASHYVVNHNSMSHIHSHPHSSPLLHKIQLGPIYEGLLNFMVEPIRPIVRPHNYHHHFAADGRTGTDVFNVDRQGLRFRTILTQFEVRGVPTSVPRGGCCLVGGPPLPCPPSFGLGTTPL